MNYSFGIGATEVEQRHHALPLPTQPVVGFRVSALSFEEHVSVIAQWARDIRSSRSHRECRSKVVCVSNVHMLMEGHWNPDFRQVLFRADMLTPDGMPLAWLTGLMKGSPQDRVAGMELMTALFDRAERLGLRIFFLGSTPDMLDRMRSRLAQDFPNLDIAGMVSPPFRALSEEEDNAIVDQITDSRADLVFVSLGCPKQERWMHEHRDRLNTVMIGLGGAFVVYAGAQQWAPAWVRQLGMEWCYRLVQEPGRLWRRYASTIPPFVFLALKQIVRVRLGFSPEVAVRRKKYMKL